MTLRRNNELICNEIDKFTIFTSLHRHSCRSISHSISYVIRLATRAACSFTGLFLLLKSLKLRSTVFLPIKLIKQANDEGWSRTLAYFIRMKSLYVNNTHYSYNLRGLAKKLGCSIGCLSVHMKALRSRGLVVDHSGNLTFKGYKKLQTDWGHKCIGVPVDHKNQLNLLRAQIIRFNLQQQEYNRKKSGIQLCPGYLKPSTLFERTDNCYAGLSAHGFGRLLKLSAAQGAAIRANLIQLGIFTSERRFCRLIASGGPSGGGPADGLMKGMKIQGLLPMYAFIKDGYILVEKRMELKYMRA